MDNGPVYALSTVHAIEEDDDYVERVQKRPRMHQHNKTTIEKVFGKDPTKKLKIPKLIDDHNY